MTQITDVLIRKSINAFKLGDSIKFSNCRVIEFKKDVQDNISLLAPNARTISITLIAGGGTYSGLSSHVLDKGNELTVSSNFGSFEFKAGTILVILY